MRRYSTSTRIAIAIVVLGAVLAVLLATGLVDSHRAEPGSGGRVPVPTATP